MTNTGVVKNIVLFKSESTLLLESFGIQSTKQVICLRMSRRRIGGFAAAAKRGDRLRFFLPCYSSVVMSDCCFLVQTDISDVFPLNSGSPEEES